MMPREALLAQAFARCRSFTSTDRCNIFLTIVFRPPTDRKQILELGKESEKLKVMRVIIQDLAHGVDQSELFPNVVKCVVCKSVELKKLVYMYLVRYADELPDLALLSISTFQKGLKVSALVFPYVLGSQPVDSR